MKSWKINNVGESEPELCCWLDTSGKTWCPVLILPLPNAQLAFCFLQLKLTVTTPTRSLKLWQSKTWGIKTTMIDDPFREFISSYSGLMAEAQQNHSKRTYLRSRALFEHSNQCKYHGNIFKIHSIGVQNSSLSQWFLSFITKQNGLVTSWSTAPQQSLIASFSSRTRSLIQSSIRAKIWSGRDCWEPLALWVKKTFTIPQSSYILKTMVTCRKIRHKDTKFGCNNHATIIPITEIVWNPDSKRKELVNNKTWHLIVLLSHLFQAGKGPSLGFSTVQQKFSWISYHPKERCTPFDENLYQFVYYMNVLMSIYIDLPKKNLKNHGHISFFTLCQGGLLGCSSFPQATSARKLRSSFPLPFVRHFFGTDSISNLHGKHPGVQRHLYMYIYIYISIHIHIYIYIMYI